MIPEQSPEDWTPTVPPFSLDTVIEDIIISYPESVVRRIFDEEDIHCFDCAVGPYDNLRDVARLHERDEDELVKELSSKFADEDPHEDPSYYDR